MLIQTNVMKKLININAIRGIAVVGYPSYYVMSV